MAHVGVFGLNLSPKSGGVYSLIDGLMAHAHLSRHTYTYLCQPRSPNAAALPANVKLVTRPPACRLATQAALRMPGIGAALAQPTLAKAVLSALGGLSPRTFDRVDGWLWPHCFVPVPALRRAMVICHDMNHRHHPEYFGRLTVARRGRAERSLRHCPTILCPSETTARDLTAAYPALATRVRAFTEAPCEIVPASACEDEAQQLAARFGRDTALFLFVAVDWPHKNHDLLIDAALALRGRTDRPFRVAFVGHRRGDAIARSIALKGAGDVVVDVGAVSRPMLGAYYRRATALLYPSLCEGFGIPLVEAMRYGLPIVAADRSCMPEVCGGAAVLLPVASPGVWAAEMERLVADPARRVDLANRSAARGNDFSWQRTWQELDEAFAAGCAATQRAPRDGRNDAAASEPRGPGGELSAPLA